MRRTADGKIAGAAAFAPEQVSGQRRDRPCPAQRETGFAVQSFDIHAI